MGTFTLRGRRKLAMRLFVSAIAVAFSASCESKGFDPSKMLSGDTYTSLYTSVVGPEKPSLYLESNIDSTEYFINGDRVGQGKRVVFVADRQPPLTILAKPTDCKQKSEILQGPLTDNAVVRFYFMGEDCLLATLPRNPTPGK